MRAWKVMVAGAALAAATLTAEAKWDSGKWLAERGDDSDMLRLRAAYDEFSAKVETPAADVVFPLEAYPDGTPKSRLTAAKAFLFLNEGFIWGEGIRVEQFKADGKTPDGVLTAENCIVDRKSKSGWVQGNAKMTWGDSAISGRGIYFSFDREFVKIFSQTEIRTKSFKLDAGKEFLKK